MKRINKTKTNLEEVWKDLDGAYEKLERALEKLSAMPSLSEELVNEVESFDISTITSLKQHVELLMEEK